MRKPAFATLFIVLFTILLTNCTNNSLKHQVETINSQCPIDLGVLGEVTKVDLDGRTIVYHVSTNSNVLKLSRLEDHVNDVKQGILLNFVDDKTSLTQFIAAQCNIRYEYTDAQTGEQLVIDITKDELKNAEALVGNDMELARRRIENFVATGRLQLPMQVDEVTTLTDIFAEGDNVGYVYTIDESTVPSDTLNQRIGVLKESIGESLKHNDLSMTMLIDALAKDHKGLIYRYNMSKSEKTFDITFTPEEVVRIQLQQQQ